MSRLNKILSGFSKVQGELDAFIEKSEGVIRKKTDEIDFLEVSREAVLIEKQKAEGVAGRIKELLGA